MANFKVVDEEGRTIRGFETKEQAQDFADEHNEDRDPNTMEYFVKPARRTTEGVDADKPVARLQIDTNAYGPLICEECEKVGDEYEGEREEVYLMQDGGIVCPECRTPFPAFDQFSSLITSVRPVKIKGSRHVCGDRCRERGCQYSFPEEDEDA